MPKRSSKPLTTYLRKHFPAGQIPDIDDVLPRDRYAFGSDEIDYSDPRLIAMQHAYSEWLDSDQLPPIKKGDEMRPILPDIGRPGARPLSTRSLLVGDSIAYLHFDWSIGFKFFRERVKELEDLIDRGLVYLVPEVILYGSGGGLSAAQEWMTARQEQMKWVWFYALGNEVAWQELGPLRKMSDYIEVAQCIMSLELSSKFPDYFDLVSLDERYTEAYKFLLESSSDQYSLTTGLHDRLSYFPKVLSLPLPNIDLSLPDMIRVRDDGLFDEWRSAFSATLTVLRDPSTALLGTQAIMVRELEKELRNVADQLTAKMNKRPSLRKAITGTAGLSVACVTGSLAAGAGPAFASAIGGGSYIAGAATHWLGTRPARGERAFKRLIVQLFDEPAGYQEVQHPSNRGVLQQEDDDDEDLALRILKRTISSHRELAKTDPGTFLPKLARSLMDQSFRLGDRGREEKALAAAEEAVTIYRQLAHASPDIVYPVLAASLNIQSLRLGELGREEEALAAAEEAVTIYRQLAQTSPDTFLSVLARLLNIQSLRLGELGREEEALAAIEEAVTIYRQLAQTSPDTFLPNLAMSLTDKSCLLDNRGQEEESLVAVEEAVTIYRQLAQTSPDTFLPNLAMSLNNQSLLVDEGHEEEALAAVEEAVTIYRQLAQTSPETFLPNLAGSLNNLVRVLKVLGRDFEALKARAEADAIQKAESVTGSTQQRERGRAQHRQQRLW